MHLLLYNQVLVHYAYQGNFSILTSFEILYNPHSIYWESSIYSPSYWCKWKFWEMVDTRISRKHIKHRFPTFPEYLSPLEWAWELAFQNIFQLLLTLLAEETVKLSFRNNDYKTINLCFFLNGYYYHSNMGCVLSKIALKRQRLRFSKSLGSSLIYIVSFRTFRVTSRDLISRKKQKSISK